MERMTVGQLKLLLADLPDDLPIYATTIVTEPDDMIQEIRVEQCPVPHLQIDIS